MYDIGNTMAIQYCHWEDASRSGGVSLGIKIQIGVKTVVVSTSISLMMF